MRLYYYKDGNNVNFGDDLNVWLWPRIAPDLLDSNDDCYFVGIGTLINDFADIALRHELPKFVFSSGVGYGRGLPNRANHWNFYAVRGPLSAERLGLAPSKGIIDGAVLVRRVYRPLRKKVFRYSYMPHHRQAEGGGKSWEAVCQRLGFGFIDPRASVEGVLDAIAETEVLITEAMHGAIVADAFRVPWIPVKTVPWLLDFKWHDWCASVGLEYSAWPLSPLWDEASTLRTAAGARRWLKMKVVRHQLRRISSTAHPALSADGTVEARADRLLEVMHQLRRDAARR
jgi:succinoglycan biosynthesis protein ExoV